MMKNMEIDDDESLVSEEFGSDNEKIENESDDDDDQYEDEDDDDEGEDGENVGKKKRKPSNKETLTSKMIDEWSEQLQGDKPFGVINDVVNAFKSTLSNIIDTKTNKKKELKYKVDGTDLFNSIVRLCMKDLFTAFLRLLNLKPTDEINKKLKLPNQGSNWKKLKVPIKTYIGDVLALTSTIIEPDILNALLRHIRLLVNFYLCFPKYLKGLIKLLIKIWSQSDEKSRVIAFICLHKIIANSSERIVDHIYKALYLAMIRNSKFTSVNTLPLINFMHRSFVELYQVNQELAYKHAFVYIRQMAIHLRNAINLKKKEAYQAVYNWQYIHSLNLWSKLLIATHSTSDGLKSLIYPLTQVITGTIKLVPTARYYPLRFHCLSALIGLSNDTNVFIPIIPFIVEIFDLTDFNKKHATISVKNLNFAIITKLSKQQLNDKSFKDVLIDTIYDYLLLYLQQQSYDIAFPELCLPLIIRLKEFLKKCKSANYCKIVKGLLEKIQENCKFIEDKRKNIQFSLKDRKSVDEWIAKNKASGTPLSQWYSRYKTMREREILMAVSNKDVISKNKVPVIERPTNEQREEERKEFGELFGNLSDDDSELDFVPKKKMKTDADEEQEMNEDGEESEEGEFDFENGLESDDGENGKDDDDDDDDEDMDE